MATREYEDKYAEEGMNYIVGIDEAGRGPLAGPLVIAGVILPPGYKNDNINDSKQITEKKRRELFEIIKQDALEIKINIVDVETIDKLNIYDATKKGMEEIIRRIDLKYDAIFVDAMPLSNVKKPVLSLIKGDQLSISIAAASIIAKVTRDDIMIELDKYYPYYDLKNNKGYGTKKNMLALEEFGATPIHRKSYAPVQRAMQMKLKV